MNKISPVPHPFARLDLEIAQSPTTGLACGGGTAEGGRTATPEGQRNAALANGD